MERTSPARATLLVTSLFIGGLIAGALTGVAAVARAQDPYMHLDLFARVLTTIERDYVDEVSSEELVNAAIDGMVDHLDRQSRWLSAEQLRDLKEDTRGNTTTLGVEIVADDSGITITRVLPGSPALRDGLAPGDRILELDGTPLVGLDVNAVRSAMEGPRGAHAVLTVMREGWEAPQRIETHRDRIHVASVEGAVFDRIVYVRLVQFQEGAGYELKQELESRIVEAGGRKAARGVVLDLRDNPGGLLTEAVAVADLFLDEGLIVSTRGRDEPLEDGEEHHAKSGGIAEHLPVVVLINGMSASASEIVAAAMQETGRGTLIGQQTWGKGTVQQVYRHAGQTALKLTVGRYYTPSGAPVAKRSGRKPDIEVRPPALPTATEALRQKLSTIDIDATDRATLTELVAALPPEEAEEEPIAWSLSPELRLQQDPVMQAALEHLISR